MEANTGTAMYPLHRCKTIYLVRHAQGIHNVEGEKDHSAYRTSHALFDAHLSPLGWNQVDCLRKHVKKCELAKRIELVITSPLLRTMQTAVGVFGGENYTDGVGAPPLMVENAGHSGRLAISSLNCPPFLAVEACRERLCVNPCDKRRSITEYRALFPAIDFSLIENDEDVLWEPHVRETDVSVAARGMKFIDWLWTREEKEIAIVSHSAFLDQTLNMYSKECHPTIRQEVGKHFANCELRSMVLVDRSMLGSDSPSRNYPGKIPAGLDLPSDVVDKKHLEALFGSAGIGRDQPGSAGKNPGGDRNPGTVKGSAWLTPGFSKTGFLYQVDARRVDDFSIKSCITVLRKMEDLSNEEKVKAFGVFKDAQNKEIFISAEPVTRLLWLRSVMDL